ncbi:MAG TPA: RimK/LysX family protein [Candidatus Saccharimonadaceae bacterium]|nr:RimK/LysX family protein [Candidatus Saccharimonadaceae bacterium]
MFHAQEILNAEDTRRYLISTRLLMLEALSKGYALTFYPASTSPNGGIVRGERGGKEVYFKSTTIASTPSYGVFAADNKALTYSLFAAKGVPTPVTKLVSSQDEPSAVYSMLSTYKKLVVKPVAMDHGDGISIGVSTKVGLSKAIAYARSASDQQESDVLVQEQVEGQEYRFLVVEGKVVAVAGRRPPCVVGDGRSTVKQLIHEKNQDPRRGDSHFSELTRIDIEDVARHKGAKFMNYVPVDGETVQLLDTSNLSRGGEAVDYTDVVSKELKRVAVLAAQACFLDGVAGIDIITDDIQTRNLDNTYVIEANLGPGIRMHMFPSEGKPRDVAKLIFKSIEKTARPVKGRIALIGRSEMINLPEHGVYDVPARIDTGATVSSLWASSIKETPEGLSFVMFDSSSEYYTGDTVVIKDYGKRAVSSSMGHTQVRYQVKMLLTLHGRRIRATMTLADRSTQTYPLLIGRNVLRNKFIVNVAAGKPIVSKERLKRQQIEEMTKEV